jgi:hypothetical protein
MTGPELAHATDEQLGLNREQRGDGSTGKLVFAIRKGETGLGADPRINGAQAATCPRAGGGARS